MSNYIQDGLARDLQSTDPRIHAQALKELASWLTSSDPDKARWAATQTAGAINTTVTQQDQAASQARLQEIMAQFWAVHEPEGLTRNEANQKLLFGWIYSNAMNQISLDSLEQAVEALGTALSRTTVPVVLSDADKLQAKLRAIRMRNDWLKAQDKSTLAAIAEQERKDRQRGVDLYADMRLTEAEKEQVQAQQRQVSQTSTRLWNPQTPGKEYDRRGLLALSATAIRALIGNGGGGTDQNKLTRFNEILSGAQPEGVTA